MTDHNVNLAAGEQDVLTGSHAKREERDGAHIRTGALPRP